MTSTAGSSEPPRVLLWTTTTLFSLVRARSLRRLRGGRDGKDGPSALRAAEALRPDVIVLDISMPDMTGFEVATRLRPAGSTAALVFLTVHADEGSSSQREQRARSVMWSKHACVRPDACGAEAHAGRGFVSPLR